jgi:hypothetical protein
MPRKTDAGAPPDSHQHIDAQMCILAHPPAAKKTPDIMRLPEFLERAQIGKTKAYELKGAGKIKTHQISARIIHWDLDSYFDAIMMSEPRKRRSGKIIRRISRNKRDPRLGVKKTTPDNTL